MKQYIVMQNGKTKISIPITDIKEIVLKESITKVPNMPDYMVGVQNIRGEIINVIDIKKFLNIQDDVESKKIVICILEDKMIGLLTEEVSEIIKLETENLKDIKEMLDISDNNFYDKITTYNDEPIIIADIKKLKNAWCKEIQ